MKTTLRAVIGKQTMEDESFRTIIYEIGRSCARKTQILLQQQPPWILQAEDIHKELELTRMYAEKIYCGTGQST
ncbi:unnamed protein product [Dracunculus medinensis]|uniref:Protein kinase domain-containing protein n=1 Tax=Dracunculus medinensis TaxID=318479 RepID=A0A0N4UR88_DRAME|nr:unnamed protein product [Dracunculus medinensis]